MLDQPPPTYNISEAAGTVPASHSPGLSKMDKISLILFVCGFAVLLVWLFSWLLYIRLKRRYEDRQKQAQMEAARRSPTGSLRLYPRRWELSAALRGLQRHAMAVNNGNANGRGLRQAEHPNLRGNSWQMDTLRPIAEEPEEQLPKYQAQEPNLPTYMEVYVNPRWGWPQSTPAQSTPAQSTPAQSTPAQSTPAQSTPAQSTSAQSTPAQSTPAQRAT